MSVATRAFKLVVAVSVAVVVFNLFYAPVPATHTPYLENHTPRDIATMQSTAADLESRLGPSEQLLSIRANYYAGSGIDHVWTSRVWTVVNKNNVGTFNESNPKYEQVHRDLTHKLQTGKIGVIVMTPRTAAVIRQWNSTERAFQSNYCRVQPRPDVYNHLQTHLYEYQPAQAGDCITTITVRWRA